MQVLPPQCFPQRHDQEGAEGRSRRCPGARACPRLATSVLALGLAATSLQAQPLFRSGFVSFQIHGPNTWSWPGDINRDGNLDFAVQKGPGAVYVCLGRGDGTLLLAMDLDTYPGATVALWDLNGDGNLDLVCPGYGQMVVRLGNGDGTFGPKRTQGVLTGCWTGYSIAVADLDGDGEQDFVVPCDNTIQAWLGRGDGSFQPVIESPIAPTGVDAIGVAVGDVTSDGLPDALVATTIAIGPLLLVPGNGDGTFGSAAPIGPSESGFISVGDLNRDGRTDVLNGGSVYLGRGDGTFDVVTPLAAPAVLYTAADLNADGNPDLIASRDSLVVVALGNGDGTFQPERTFPSALVLHACVGDFNGDGYLDILAPGNLGYVSLHLGRGDGTFGATNDYATGLEPWGVIIAEVSGDGRPDVLTANRGGSTISVLLGDGTGRFAARSDFPTGAGPRAIAVGDLNADGLPDVVTANESGASVSVLLGLGGGFFESPQDLAMGSSPSGVVVADFNWDGLLDVITANGGSKDVTLRLGDGTGGLGAVRSFSVAGATGGLAIGDLNGDSQLDVVTGSDTWLSVLVGDGAGGFAPRRDYQGSARGLAVGDVNRDGRADVVAASYNGTRIFLGNGDGTLQAPLPSFLVKQVTSLAMGDVNGDALLDLVAADQFGCTAGVALGNGDGTFGSALGYGGNGWASAVALGDVNLDGAPDIALASWGSSVVSVFLNARGGPVPALPALVSAEAEPGLVRLAWQGVAGQSVIVTVYRRDQGNDWLALGTVMADASGRIVFEDRGVAAGATYTYCLSLHDLRGEVYFGEVTVQVPAGSRLALEGLRPNPAGEDLVATFSLSGKGPATLEVFDLAGRRVLACDVGDLGPGNHVANLQPERRLAPGLYLLRLTSGGQTLTAKGVVAR